MPQNSRRILVVEGEADHSFFEVLCRQLGLEPQIQVAIPKALDPKAFNSKEGVFNLLERTLLRQLEDGETEALAVVVDADSPPNGGFAVTRARAERVLVPFGYSLAAAGSGGLIYKHNDGLADFGLWVMPDNAGDGMLEHWLTQAIAPAERPLLGHAESVVAALPPPVKFKQIHRIKAEVATWLAWQRTPGHGSYRALEEGLLDTSSEGYRQLAAWLTEVFKH